ncbi:MAG: metallophosphoesterase [Myxococcales bacterium]|nr:metallophosphoesterase [Myxococcales bacterium]
MPMVGWYNPIQLIRTGIDVAMSTLFGRRADFRLLEAIAAQQGVFDRSDRESITIDYVADLGDGFNSTYAIASLISKEELDLPGVERPLRRGEILIMGGDQVYPTPGKEGYHERLVAPYAATPRTGASVDLFAIPGNHDWYDGLTSFSRLFCQQRSIGHCATHQTRSYFAIRLPHHWWLIAVDIQLESDIDMPQVDYFKTVAKKMGKGDKIILCTPEPDWIYGNIYSAKYKNNLAFLETHVFKEAKVWLRLAGDLHHYRRHESTSGVQNITAGGGGAFLHPTHGEDVNEITAGPDGETFRCAGTFPDPAISRRLAYRNLIFARYNPRFGSIPAFLYTLLLWGIFPASSGSFAEILWNIVARPGTLTAALGVAAAFVLLTDTHKLLYRVLGGGLHGLIHVAAALLLGYCAGLLFPGAAPGSWGFTLFVFFGGYLVGSAVMGLYLLISLNCFGRHANEAFSSLRHDGFKNFLRIRINKDGLTIYPVGLERVPRTWRRDDDGTFSPAGNIKLSPRLIEKSPIKIPRLADGQGDLGESG